MEEILLKCRAIVKASFTDLNTKTVIEQGEQFRIDKIIGMPLDNDFISYKYICSLSNDYLNINIQLTNFQIIDEFGNVNNYTVNRSSSGEPKSLNDFILESIQISEDKRKLPLMIQCPNGLEVHPSIKMKFENYGSPLLGDKLEAIHITWRE